MFPSELYSNCWFGYSIPNLFLWSTFAVGFEEKSVGILLYNSKVNKTVLIYFSLIRRPGNRHRPRLELANCRVCFLFENIFKITWNLPQRNQLHSLCHFHKDSDVKIEVVWIYDFFGSISTQTIGIFLSIWWWLKIDKVFRQTEFCLFLELLLFLLSLLGALYWSFLKDLDLYWWDCSIQ